MPAQRHQTKGTARNMTSLPTMKVAVTILALGAATASVIFGSMAAWTAQTSNPTNSVSTGTLTLATDKPAASVFAATNVTPGDSGSETVTVRNTSSVGLDLTLTQSAVSQDAGTALQFQIHDGTNCVYPAAVGACVAFGAWDGTATLAALGQGTLAASNAGTSDERTYTVGWKLDASSPNADQGTSNSFTLQWDGIPA